MKLSPIFGDHTVLQANKPIRIFGSGAGKAEASFDGETQTAHSDGGSWCLTFSPRPYGGPYELSLSLNGEKSVYTDIFVGEVLLLAGQSNIAQKLRRTTYGEENYEENPMLRYFAARRFADEDAYSPEDGWVSCTKENAAYFSALGYHVGMEMSKQKKIAVGLIACYLGSSVIESWIPAEIGNQERFYLPREEKYDSPYVRGPHNEYGMLYRTRQQSVVPFSIGRVIWYQGESNTGKSEWKHYTELLSELISCWRRDFMDEALPFTVVQIADWDARQDDAWRGIQRAQERISEVAEHVTVIRSADVCETFDIHPPTKIRLAMRILESIG
ncbi:MAG: hypothetical protein IKC59_05465 [Clostridia bacterium]|nr:hypothetical protein [Clostridia bacterium]